MLVISMGAFIIDSLIYVRVQLTPAVELMRGMDVADYLRRQKEHLVEQAKLVRDFGVFEFDYIPDQPLMREEATRLMDEMLRFEISGIPTHHVLIGSRGSGKTLSVKFLQRIVTTHTDLVVLYANCREHNTSFKVLAHLLGVQARGASLAELFQEFCARHAGKTVVLLDEIDLMSPKDPRASRRPAHPARIKTSMNQRPATIFAT